MHAESGSSALARGLLFAAACLSGEALSLLPAAATDTVIYSFNFAPDAANPVYGVAKGPDGRRALRRDSLFGHATTLTLFKAVRCLNLPVYSRDENA